MHCSSEALGFGNPVPFQKADGKPRNEDTGVINWPRNSARPPPRNDVRVNPAECSRYSAAIAVRAAMARLVQHSNQAAELECPVL
jgi:hypothetical protein